MEQHLHIICFTVPYPVDYGGVVDLFWKLPSLQQQGIKIHLHCFDYGRGEQNELNEYCESVTYYKRNNPIATLCSSKPYIVASRDNKILLNNLLSNDYPILCEGIHSTYLLNDKRFDTRKVIVRLHNVENEYYQHLHNTATSFLKQIFYARESKLLKKYEAFVAKKAAYILTVTKQDAINYKSNFDCKNAYHLPLFLPNNWAVNIKEGNGNYCLYNGDLSVDANSKAIEWLLQNVMAKLPQMQFIVAGKNPSQNTVQLISTQKNVQLIANPSSEKMNDLIANAQINLLPSFSNAGIKLKFLNALFNGRHCIANNETIAGSELDDLCFIANTDKEFVEAIEKYYSIPFTNKIVEQRKIVLGGMFSNTLNAKLLIKYL